MVHDTKIAIVVRSDLPTWQKLNVTAYLASALAAGPAGVGEPYLDASGGRYLPMFGQPVLVFAGTAEDLGRVRRRCAERDLPVAIFTEELFQTGDDVANRAAVRAVPSDQLNLAGIATYQRRVTVDKVLKGLRLHP